MHVNQQNRMKEQGSLQRNTKSRESAEVTHTGYTILPERVTCETELIALIRSKAAIEAGGVLYGKTAKDKMGPAHKILTYSFWFYNKGGALLKKRKRILKGKIENPATPIDPIEIPYLHNIKKQK